MPVFDFSCRACNHQFELLVRGKKVPVCPECASEDLERLLSLPAVRSSTTKAMAMRAARKRDAKQGHERVQEQILYEKNHD